MNTGKDAKLLCNATGGATGAQAAVGFQLGPDVGASGCIEVTGGAASVQIEGRISPEGPWVSQFSSPQPLTATAFFSINRIWPEMRANITTNPGTVRVWILG